MNLSQLRTFVAIADNGGFARAAARLHLTQSAASRHILALEAEFGVSLFDRIGRRVQLTSEGEDLLRRCRRVLSEADSLLQRAGALKGGQTGTLRVGATPHVIETVLSGFLKGYRARHPGIEVQLVEEGGARLSEHLERGDIHIAHMPAGDERFQGQLLYPIYLMLVLSEEHRLCRHAFVDIRELADEPLLLLRPGFGSHEWFMAACHLAQVNPRVLAESGAPHTVIALAATGYGVAIVPSNVQISPSRVRVLPIVNGGASIGRWSMAAWNPRRFLAPYAKQFADELVASVHKHHPGRELVRQAPAMPKPKVPTALCG